MTPFEIVLSVALAKIVFVRVKIKRLEDINY